MTRSGDADGYYTCERCGRRKAVGSRCTSCGGDHGGPPERSGEPQAGAIVDRMVPEGWDPELTRSSRPRLEIVRRPEPGDGAERGE